MMGYTLHPTRISFYYGYKPKFIPYRIYIYYIHICAVFKCAYPFPSCSRNRVKR